VAYFDVYSMTQSGSLRGRLSAAASTEPDGPADPEGWANEHRWEIVSAPGWGDAWASAVAADNPDPGADPGVITDGMILAEVQAVLGSA
jgi:hypothetical protein